MKIHIFPSYYNYLENNSGVKKNQIKTGKFFEKEHIQDWNQ